MKHARAEGEPPQQPQPVVVEKGDLLTVVAYYGEAGLGMQFRVSTVVRRLSSAIPRFFSAGNSEVCLVAMQEKGAGGAPAPGRRKDGEL
eukprot:COSAG04_NODE_8916_length_917_cov_1.496333_2_plen_89_part_00